MEEEKDGESVSQKTENESEDEEESSLNEKDEEEKVENGGENNNGVDGEDLLGSNFLAKEMMSFHPSMDDLVELISESGVIFKIKRLFN